MLESEYKLNNLKHCSTKMIRLKRGNFTMNRAIWNAEKPCRSHKIKMLKNFTSIKQRATIATCKTLLINGITNHRPPCNSLEVTLQIKNLIPCKLNQRRYKVLTIICYRWSTLDNSFFTITIYCHYSFYYHSKEEILNRFWLETNAMIFWHRLMYQ